MEASKRIELVQLSAQAFCESDALSEQAQHEIISALDGATLDEYESVRMSWQGAYSAGMAERSADSVKPSDEAIRKAWSRLMKASAIEKPKATSAAATKQSEKRAADKKIADAAEKMLETLDDVQVMESIASLAPFASDGNISAVQRIKSLKSEQVRRIKAAEAAESETTKKLRADVTGMVKTATHEQLEFVRAFLAGEVEVSVPEEPEQQIELAA